MFLRQPVFDNATLNQNRNSSMSMLQINSVCCCFCFMFVIDIEYAIKGIDTDDKSKERPNGVAAMAFVQAAANLRARCYALPCADRLTAQRVVGRLCPSMVCSLFIWLRFAFCC
jgi:hypothetical protein